MKPNKAEELFLTLGYNRFYDLYNEIIDDEFWDQEDWYRFSRVSNIFSIYSELLNYEPFKHVFISLKLKRPPMESVICSALFKFIRNILIHFPVFETWNDVWINEELANWQRKGLSIDCFLKKYTGHEQTKYRLWDSKKKRMTYISINFPEEYNNNRIYLKDMIAEKDGVKLSLVMMKKVLNTQIESIY